VIEYFFVAFGKFCFLPCSRRARRTMILGLVPAKFKNSSATRLVLCPLLPVMVFRPSQIGQFCFHRV